MKRAVCMIRNLVLILSCSFDAVGTTATSVNFGSPLVDVLRGLAQIVRLPGDLERRLECRAARLLG